jgi:hypothetical protein
MRWVVLINEKQLPESLELYIFSRSTSFSFLINYFKLLTLSYATSTLNQSRDGYMNKNEV